MSVYYNIQINFELGNLINAIQETLKTTLTGDQLLSHFVNLIKHPVKNLLFDYFAQVNFKFKKN